MKPETENPIRKNRNPKCCPPATSSRTPRCAKTSSSCSSTGSSSLSVTRFSVTKLNGYFTFRELNFRLLNFRQQSFRFQITQFQITSYQVTRSRMTSWTLLLCYLIFGNQFAIVIVMNHINAKIIKFFNYTFQLIQEGCCHMVASKTEKQASCSFYVTTHIVVNVACNLINNPSSLPDHSQSKKVENSKKNSFYRQFLLHAKF